MTKVEFYEIAVARWQTRLCAKVAELYGGGSRVYLLTGSRAGAADLDELLWVFADESFIPHSICSDKGTGADPVSIGFKIANPNGASVLVIALPLITDEVLKFSKGFATVIDFVPKLDMQATAAARARYKVFQDAGMSMHFNSSASARQG